MGEGDQQLPPKAERRRVEAGGLLRESQFSVKIGWRCRLISITPEGKSVTLATVKSNHPRLRRHDFTSVELKSLRLKITATNGSEQARVYEVRCYAEQPVCMSLESDRRDWSLDEFSTDCRPLCDAAQVLTSNMGQRGIATKRPSLRLRFAPMPSRM